MAEQPELNITKDELIPYIKTQGELLAKEINKAKEKYGSRYNTKNKFEIMRDKFGDPRWCAEQFANEWFLILQKSSKLPASVRYPVRDICQAAMNQCYHDKLVALYKKQQEEQKKKEECRMSKIEWTEKTWNPIHGCTKVSEACQNCYAEVMARRLQGNHIKSYENGFKVSRNIDAMKEPYQWQKPTMVFVCSMGDLFHEDVPDTWITPVMRVIEKTPQHTYQILTKRPWRMEEYFLSHPLPKNVWLGTTCENSRHYDRIDALRNVRGNNVKFLSCEPLLGAMNDINLDGIDWVITGGESGPCARRTPIEWFRGLRNACRRWNTPFFFKQWGTWGADGIKRSKKENGSILDGETFKEYPRRR